MQHQDDPVDYSQPVAYDHQGRPLYAHPPEEKPASQDSAEKALHQAVHIARAAEPVKPTLSEATVTKHKESQKRYPKLNLSDGEYVIMEIRRHPVGLILPVLATMATAIIAGVMLMSYDTLFPTGEPTQDSLVLPAISLVLLVAMISYIAIWVYQNNRFFLTNESVIQEIQHTLFFHNEQTVSLANIEDASYQRHNIVQNILDYGTIRLSTEGEETTYVFHYVTNPKKQIAILHNAVEAFKNGRPVTGED
jgi:uncharacterized membrane protein YdbT with pleckstrin-like domain